MPACTDAAAWLSYSCEVAATLAELASQRTFDLVDFPVEQFRLGKQYDGALGCRLDYVLHPVHQGVTLAEDVADGLVDLVGVGSGLQFKPRETLT